MNNNRTLHMPTKERIGQEELSMYQDSMRVFMQNETIKRSLGQSNIRIDQITLVMDSSDDVPENKPSVMFKGKYSWLRLIMNSVGKDLRFQIDLKELEQTYGKNS